MRRQLLNCGCMRPCNASDPCRHQPRIRRPCKVETRLPAAELEAIRGDRTKATEVLDVIVRKHGHRR